MKKNKPVLKLDHFVPYRLSIASNVVSDLIASAYQDHFGISIPEWRLITVLAERGPSTQLDLGAVTLMDKVTVSRAAVTLVSRKLVTRKPHAQDKRSHLLILTASGQALYDDVVPRALKLEKSLLMDFKRSEVKQFLKFLNRLVDSSLEAQK